MTRILVVEDEESYRDPLTYQLTREGFDVVEAATGPNALSQFAARGADIILLDVMLPGLSGTEVCREIRTASDVPIIMLTAKDSEIDKVVGLELGADDYVTKPYSFRELLARVRAVLRRRGTGSGSGSAGGTAAASSGTGGAAAPSSSALHDGDDVLVAGPIRMDVERHTVTVRDEPVAMPLKEFDLLEMLLRNAGRVLTRGQLIDRVWGLDYVGDTKTLDVHVKRLRAKIEAEPGAPELLLTVRGLGYKLDDGA